MASILALKSNRKTIKEPMEKQEIWVIRRFHSNEILYSKNSIQKSFKFFLQDDMSKKLNKGMYNNISNSMLHWETTKTPVLPCLDVIEWMT